MSLLGYPKFIAYTKFEHFGISRFLVMLLTVNRQTNRHTDSSERSTLANRQFQCKRNVELAVKIDAKTRCFREFFGILTMGTALPCVPLEITHDFFCQ